MRKYYWVEDRSKSRSSNLQCSVLSMSPSRLQAARVATAASAVGFAACSLGLLAFAFHSPPHLQNLPVLPLQRFPFLSTLSSHSSFSLSALTCWLALSLTVARALTSSSPPYSGVSLHAPTGWSTLPPTSVYYCPTSCRPLLRKEPHFLKFSLLV